MTEKVFVDTNVLVYAHDRDAGEKRRIAAALLEELWSERTGVLSLQVLQEFYVNVTRKIPERLAARIAHDIVGRYSEWVIAPLGPSAILEASELEEARQISFWDALVVVAATRAGATRIASEDRFGGGKFSGLAVYNPFDSAQT